MSVVNMQNVDMNDVEMFSELFDEMFGQKDETDNFEILTNTNCIDDLELFSKLNLKMFGYKSDFKQLTNDAKSQIYKDDVEIALTNEWPYYSIDKRETIIQQLEGYIREKPYDLRDRISFYRMLKYFTCLQNT